MRFSKGVRFLFLFMVCLVIALAVSPIWASERGRNHNTNIDINVDSNNASNSSASASSSAMMSGNSNNIAFDSKAYVMGSHSLGDVDINQCIVTHQKGSFVVSWQGYDYNLWCMGEVFDAKGLPQMGALMRCDINEIRRHFPDDGACLAANTVVPAPLALPASADELDYHQEQERFMFEQQLIHEESEEENRRSHDDLAALTARLDSYERGARAAKREQDERDDEQRAYAQATLEDLADYRK